MVHLRAAGPADASAIAALHAESWRRHYRGAYPDVFLDGPVFDDRRLVWEARLAAASAQQHILLAEDETGLAGFACAYGGHDPYWGSLLDNLHVRAEQHGRGIGARLLRGVAAWCGLSHPRDGLYLWVLEHNTPAQAFYRRLGAQDAGAMIKAAPGGGEVTARRFIWTSAGVEALTSSSVPAHDE